MKLQSLICTNCIKKGHRYFITVFYENPHQTCCYCSKPMTIIAIDKAKEIISSNDPMKSAKMLMNQPKRK